MKTDRKLINIYNNVKKKNNNNTLVPTVVNCKTILHT